MDRFIKLVELDVILIIRNKIVAVAAIVTLLYTIIIQILPDESYTEILTILIFSDPVMLGFMFTGALVLFEKSSNTLQALSVTPVRPGEYLWSKGISLTSIALIASFIMAMAGVGIGFDPFYLFLAVASSSLLFIFGGFTGVSNVRTFNQYFIIIPLFMIPACLPFLNWLDVTDTLVWYAIPTQASLILFDIAFRGTNAATLWEMVYALIYMPAAVYISYRFAKKSWYKTLNS